MRAVSGDPEFSMLPSTRLRGFSEKNQFIKINLLLLFNKNATQQKIETHQNKAGWEGRGRGREKAVWTMETTANFLPTFYVQLTQVQGELERQ